MKKRVVLLFIYLAVSGLRSEEMNALEQRDRHLGGWVGWGFGKSYFGPTVHTSLSLAYRRNIVSVRFLKADEFRFNMDGDYDEPALSFHEKAVLFGRSIRKEILVFTLSGGVGYLTGTDRGKLISNNHYESAPLSIYGFSFEIGFRFELCPIIGIGGLWFGNINRQKNFSGGMIQVYLGSF